MRPGAAITMAAAACDSVSCPDKYLGNHPKPLY